MTARMRSFPLPLREGVRGRGRARTRAQESSCNGTAPSPSHRFRLRALRFGGQVAMGPSPSRKGRGFVAETLS
jgi:hypothetical protein